MKWILNHLQLITLIFFGVFVVYLVRRHNKKAKIAEVKLKKSIDANLHEPLTLHPEIDPVLCMGCGACTRACPEGEILNLVNNKATLVSPTKCVGHGECERACPTSAISLVFGTKTRGMDIPRITTNFETNVPGLYIAGELGGMGLIRNAFRQGVAAVEHAVQNLKPIPSAEIDCDIFIIGAGPAGLAAGVAAIAAGKKYICIEQNSFGGTISNFPRQKVIMTHPAELPIIGVLKFDTNKVSKENLLKIWKKIKSQLNLHIHEQTTFQNLEKVNGIFRIHTSKGIFTAQKVVLAMGVRGSPRRLGLMNEDLPKVTYNLLDPEQYTGRKIVVVGGGNAGVEAAQMLGTRKYNNKVVLAVRGPQFDRCNDENQQIIFKMQKEGLVDIWFNSSVKAIEPDTVTIQRDGKLVVVANDFLFIFAGAEMPSKMLMNLGIAIDKKFGEKRAS